MKTVKLLVHEQMLFALLSASLHQREVETAFFHQVSPRDWKECYLLAARQGVMALAWDGLLKLPTELMPPKALKLTWGLAVEAYEKKYERYCRTVDELLSFYQTHGIAAVQLKGVGLSACYPVPCHREGGDIDIYTYSADVDKMSHPEANALADQLMARQGIEVEMHSLKHSNFTYNGIPIENHKTLLDVQWYTIAPQVEQILKGLLSPQTVKLMDGKYSTRVPSPAFNSLFVAFHSAQHYGSGLALHHLCDWAVLLQNYGLHLPDEVTDPKFRRGVMAFTSLCNRYLGTSVPMVEPAQLDEEMLDSILHPRFTIGSVPVKGNWNVLSYKARRFVYVHRLNNQILEWPMWKRVWDMVSKKLHHPETVFHTYTE